MDAAMDPASGWLCGNSDRRHSANTRFCPQARSLADSTVQVGPACVVIHTHGKLAAAGAEAYVGVRTPQVQGSTVMQPSDTILPATRSTSILESRIQFVSNLTSSSSGADTTRMCGVTGVAARQAVPTASGSPVQQLSDIECRTQVSGP